MRIPTHECYSLWVNLPLLSMIYKILDSCQRITESVRVWVVWSQAIAGEENIISQLLLMHNRVKNSQIKVGIPLPTLVEKSHDTDAG